MRILLVIFSALFVASTYAQNTVSDKPVAYGLQLSNSSDAKSLHMAVGFTLTSHDHCVYLGPQFTLILQNPPTGDGPTQWDTTAFGLEAGYRYYFATKALRLKGFLQFNYLIYKGNRTDYSLGPPRETTRSFVNVENSGTIGLNYQLAPKLFLNGSFGMSSYEGFFLIIESVHPCIYLGLEYRFN
jgi:hypothetical protein